MRAVGWWYCLGSYSTDKNTNIPGLVGNSLEPLDSKIPGYPGNPWVVGNYEYYQFWEKYLRISLPSVSQGYNTDVGD